MKVVMMFLVNHFQKVGEGFSIFTIFFYILKEVVIKRMIRILLNSFFQK